MLLRGYLKKDTVFHDDETLLIQYCGCVPLPLKRTGPQIKTHQGTQVMEECGNATMKVDDFPMENHGGSTSFCMVTWLP